MVGYQSGIVVFVGQEDGNGWVQSAGIIVFVGQEDGNGLVLVWDRCFGG